MYIKLDKLNQQHEQETKKYHQNIEEYSRQSNIKIDKLVSDHKKEVQEIKEEKDQQYRLVNQLNLENSEQLETIEKLNYQLKSNENQYKTKIQQ